jgi:hypothetical protein
VYPVAVKLTATDVENWMNVSDVVDPTVGFVKVTFDAAVSAPGVPAVPSTTVFPEARLTDGVVLTATVWTVCANAGAVCPPTNVCAASVRATLALVLGNVSVVPSVPAKVTVFETESFFPLATAVAFAVVDQLAAVVPLSKMHETYELVPAGIKITALDPEELTVIVAVELF